MLEPNPQSHLTIAIIDDDDAVRGALELLIQSFGWKAHTYASATAFLDRASPIEPDCIILDLYMPGMNGADLLEHLRMRGIDTPVIVFTGHLESPLARRAMQAGAAAILRKPFHDGELLDHLQQICAVN